jgi:hypothetical protein
MSFRTRNVKSILDKEKELFDRIGMIKVGYEGFVPDTIFGGEVWYIASFPDKLDEKYTISFVSWFGEIRLYAMRWLNPKVIDKA